MIMVELVIIFRCDRFPRIVSITESDAYPSMRIKSSGTVDFPTKDSTKFDCGGRIWI